MELKNKTDKFYIYKAVRLLNVDDENSSKIAEATIINQNGESEILPIYYSTVAKKIIDGIITRLEIWQHAYMSLILELSSKMKLHMWADNYNELIPPRYIQEQFLEITELEQAMDYPEKVARKTLVSIQTDINGYKKMLQELEKIGATTYHNHKNNNC